MRGMLVEQNANDEPAIALLEQVRGAKALGGKGGKKPAQEVAIAELPFPAPAGWEFARISMFCELENGDRSKNYPSRDEFVTSGIPFINAGHLQSGGVSLRAMNYIPESRFNLLKAGKVRNGDILFCLRGSLGKAAIVSNISRGAIASSLVILRAMAPINPRFALAYFISSLASEMTRRFDNGTAQPNLSSADLGRFVFPLPPLAEQHRIVTKVDELMSLCDRLEVAQAERESRRDRLAAASLHRLNQPADTDAPEVFRKHACFYLNHLPRLTTSPEQIKQLRQTIFNLAVRGRLVPRQTNDEPASLLHERLRAALTRERRNEETRSRKDVLSTAKEFFDDGTFPTTWVLTNFDEVNAIVSGVAKGKPLQGLKTATYPYLRVANVQRGYLNLDVIKEIEIRADEFDRYRLRQQDVLMTEGGDWDKLGRAAIWSGEIEKCIHQNHIYRIRSACPEALLPEWIVLFANSPLGRSYFEGASKQTTNLASINMTQLRSCPLPLPPTAEQRRIVARVAELTALCDQLEAQLSVSQAEGRRLLDAVLHKTIAITTPETFEMVGNQ